MTSSTRTNYRWLVCALLFLATTINYIDRQILSLLKPLLMEKFNWSNTDFGVVNTYFQGAYAAGLLGFGWMVDKYGAKIGYSISIVFWSIAAACHALAGSLAGFCQARAFLGISEAGNFPAAIKAVTQWFPRKERAFATSIFNAGANAGPIIAPATVPWLATHWGWQSPFLAAALLGFIWLVFWLWLFETPERHPRVNSAELDHIRSDQEQIVDSQKISWISLLAYPQAWSFIVAKFLTDPVWWFFLIWLPGYFYETKHLTISGLGFPLIVIYSIVTVLSIYGGWMTKFLIQRGWEPSRARKICMFCFALCVIPIWFVGQCGLWGAVLLIALAASAHQAWSANLYTTVSDMFPKSAVASVIGMGGMAGSIGGLFFPIITGKLLDHYKALDNLNGGYSVLFSICACAYVVAFVLNHALAPRFAKVTLEDLQSKTAPVE